MMRASLPIAALLVHAVPVAAQSHEHMPGMTMAMPMPAPAPRATPGAKAKAKAKVAPAPHRAASGASHPRSAGGDSHSGHAMPSGHDISEMQDMPGMKMNEPVPDTARPAPGGTDLPAGSAPAPPVRPGRAADRFYDPAAMAHAEAALLGGHGGMVFQRLLVNLAEYQAREGRDSYRWDAEFWIGGDLHRIVLKSQGEGEWRGRAGRAGRAEVQALYSRALDPYWNLQLGVRQDIEPRPARTYAVLGVEGVAPYWIEFDPALFVSDKGDVLARVDGHYDQRLTQRLILQPRAELEIAAQDMPRDRIGAGLSQVELGLRLRYELVREFAPYVGVSWERKVGKTADFARAAGEDRGGIAFVAGLRTWF